MTLLFLIPWYSLSWLGMYLAEYYQLKRLGVKNPHHELQFVDEMPRAFIYGICGIVGPASFAFTLFMYIAYIRSKEHSSC